MKSVKKKQKLNVRERKFIKFVMAGESATEAMRKAGYAENTAKIKQSEKLAKVSPTIQQLMEKRGLTDDRLLDVLDQGLNATKVISANVIRGKPDSIADDQDGMADAHSMTKDFIDVEDYAVRHKYLETGLKIKGHLRDKVEVGGEGGGPLIFKVVYEDKKRAEES